MNSIRLSAIGLTVWALCAQPDATFAQDGNGDLAPNGGVWHSARLLRAELSDSSSGADRLRAAALELSLARPERARAILESSDGLAEAYPAEFRELMADLEYELGAFDRAGALFRESATEGSEPDRGIAAARAGDAFELAGRPEVAAEQYRLAASLIPALAPWLAFREARVTSDTAVVSKLLERLPPELQEQALTLWADKLLAAGDTAPAVSAYVGAGRHGTAARLSLALGDTVEARRLAYRAIAVGDSASASAGLHVVDAAAPPQTALELEDVARSHGRNGSVRTAIRFAEQAIAMDSAPASAFEYLGDLLDRLRQRQRAISVYTRAAELEGESAVSAAYKRARLLLRTDRAAGRTALAEFAERHPQDSRAPLAMYLVADAARDRRRHAEADSLFRVIATNWPRSDYASRGRFDMVARHLARRDTAAAIALYAEESRVRGPRRRAAEYFQAALRAAQGDSLEARGMWAALTRSDSLGYYGTMARDIAGLPPMRIEPVRPGSLSTRANRVFGLLDFFRAARYEAEEDILIDHIFAAETGSASEWLDLAEGLIERGRTAEGVRLGWRAARVLTLNHPRVLRAIFPWPMREAIEAEARKFGVDPYLVVGLIRQESAFRVSVVSHAGAHGLMQLMPPTARQVARRLGMGWDRSLLHVADANLHMGIYHFAQLLKRYDGDVVPALAAYNAGSTPVRRWLRYPEAGDAPRWIERVPYRETRGYLQTVLRNRALYRALYPQSD